MSHAQPIANHRPFMGPSPAQHLPSQAGVCTPAGAHLLARAEVGTESDMDSSHVPQVD
eukprot:CAMPEP_0174385714 /NCGR_PEP_ID=MMETSP0811_2-20130205/126786_1 /TAXON_ID=73025 ORGANISM="Eutreptiella gymnastica-like, Strain CCMP1594" /NCGR_SAMPLE_ID=MMETSP0811_2 /ASSEMBLY_ACC=CAM_ASM_000667 /LENGTH=57 /DNA_ID=CAMNT_0015540141 /DNA_START=821 /DNA_END=994 /DNA_ORIENTATION=+